MDLKEHGVGPGAPPPARLPLSRWLPLESCLPALVWPTASGPRWCPAKTEGVRQAGRIVQGQAGPRSGPPFLWVKFGCVDCPACGWGLGLARGGTCSRQAPLSSPGGIGPGPRGGRECWDPCRPPPGGDAGGGRPCPGRPLRGHLFSPQQPRRPPSAALRIDGPLGVSLRRGHPPATQCFMGD